MTKLWTVTERESIRNAVPPGPSGGGAVPRRARPSTWWLALLPGLALGSQGCLNDTYRIPDAEAARLASTPPEWRAGAIRTVQRTTMATEITSEPYLPPGAPPPPAYAPPGSDAPVGYYDPSPRVYVGVGLWSPLPPPYYVSRPYQRRSLTAPSVRGGSGSGMRSSGGGGSGGGGKVDKDALIVLAVVGAAFTLGMVGTEGARFDGWTRVHPAQPIHLIYENGTQRAVPLYLLSQADLQGMDEAVIAEYDGQVQRLARAPLDRKGFVWRFEGGAVGGTLPDARSNLGWGVLMGLGYFPWQRFGLLFDLGLVGGTLDGTDYTNVRFGAEANAMPLALGRFHLGLFGSAASQSAAQSSATMDKTSLSSWMLGGGAMAELELTTRLALVLRGGMQKEVRDSGDAAPAIGLVTAGVSIY